MPATTETQRAMGLVLLATLPGGLTLFALHGWGTLITLLLAAAAGLTAEAAAQRLRRRSPRSALSDGSALVSCTLLALALPPYSPWWLTLAAASAAILLGKQLFGGVGRNPFNPAMLGYAIVLLAFPLQMSQWPAPHAAGLGAALQQIFVSADLPDAWAQATVLDVLRVDRSRTIEELFCGHPAFGHLAGRGSEWVNLAFLLGGLFLLQRRLFGWHAPAGMLAGLFLMSLLFWNGSGSDSHGSPLLQLFSGASMLGAFFIVTEPVSGPEGQRARLLFGVGVGVLTYLIRAWGAYPDGLAFAVLLMNLAVPALQRHGQGRPGTAAP
ncbi:MAG: RnfABCDGE type electron transport complex subunit D [Pseudomonas sp.]|uniref:RnfABCDGE type electron transport complex subunit D n=1 Tax=Pseudomonas sp. TaxID=306 RepID=UPI00339B7E57